MTRKNPLALAMGSVNDIDGHKYELYITFKELCNASTTDEKEWIIKSEGTYLIIEFFS